MKNAKLFFHKISYLQYPLMFASLGFAAAALWFVIQAINAGSTELNRVWEFANYTLIFMGLGISFSTLQDTSKTQNNFSLKVWQNPTYSKLFLSAIAIYSALFIGIGLFVMFAVTNESLQEVSLGMIVMGIGMIGLLKTAIEMADHHGQRS